MTDDEMVKIAQEHGGRYLILLSAWLDKEDATRQVCDRLVKCGRARWLGIKDSWGDGEPGPGIQLIGKDEAAS